MMLVLETVIFVILYMVYHTLWLHIATHSLHWHTEYVTPSSSDHTGTTSSIDAVPSYLVGYEGRRLGICTILLFPWLLHCIGIWSYVAASIRDRTCTTSFIGHNDATSYIVGYEGRRHGIHIAYALWFWIMVYMFWIQDFGEILRSNASPKLAGDWYLSCIWSTCLVCYTSWIIIGLPWRNCTCIMILEYEMYALNYGLGDNCEK